MLSCKSLNLNWVRCKHLIIHDVLGNRDGMLLPIKNLVCVSPGLRPVHDVQRKSVHYGINDGCTLLLPVNELTLEGRANRKTVIVAKYTAIAIILVVLDKVRYLDFGFCDFYNNFLSLPTMLISSALFIIAFIIFCVNLYLEITCFWADA